MSCYTFSISPDYLPSDLTGWFIFNTWLQKITYTRFHLELHDSFEQQRYDLDDDKIDLIYANPFDAAKLVREKGFKPLVKPQNRQDEVVVLVRAESLYQCVEDLSTKPIIISADDPDVLMMGFMLLEPADVVKDDEITMIRKSHVQVAKGLLNKEGDIAFMLKSSFDELSDLIKWQMRVLVESRIDLITHVLMASPRLEPLHDSIRNSVLALASSPKGPSVMEFMPMKQWQNVEEEEAEFMIDLMDAIMS
jgi:phosphonate transport system substrate-binding protein